MEFSKSKNYYQILEIEADATYLEVKSAYRRLARKYHPDVNKTQEALGIFKEITKAYETLSDEKKRNKYDIINGIFKTTTAKTQTLRPEPSVKKTTEEINKNKANKKSKRENFIKNLKFWSAKIKKNQREKEFHKPQKGENLTTEITISPEEAITGSKRIVHIHTTKTCPQCGGHRFTNGQKCPTCNGSGSITENKRLIVTIPKNIKHGAKLRLKAEGAQGKNGGAPGDVFILIKIEAKTQIHYDKLNIYYNIPITPFEAALGEEINIPGNIKLKLPPNTSSGQKFRIAKQGIKKGNKIGDLIVTVNIEFSQNLSDNEIKLYEQLKNLSKDNVRKNFGYGC